jgi:hypothetical protein
VSARRIGVSRPQATPQRWLPRGVMIAKALNSYECAGPREGAAR